MTWWAVVLGASVGAPCRYLLDRAVGQPPWGVLLVNLVGSLLAGVLAGAALDDGPAASLLVTGFLGAFTTASTVVADVLESQIGAARRARLLALHVVPGLVLAAGGLAVGRGF